MRPREYRDGVKVGPVIHDCCPACGAANERASILIYQAGRYRILHVREINALIARHKYLDVITRQGPAGLVELSLDQMERLYPKDWWRIHRNALVRLAAIREVVRVGDERESAAVIVAGCDKPILVAKRRSAEFRRAILGTFTSRHQDARGLA